MIADIKQEAVEHCTAKGSRDYVRAIAEIERLERELKQTKHALGESLNVRDMMSESLKKCTATLNAVEYQLKNTEAALIYSNECVNECVDWLRQENRALKLSGELWLKRSIDLKFELLMANKTINNIKAQLDLAVSKITSPGG